MSRIPLLTEIFPGYTHLRKRPLYTYQPHFTTDDPRQIASMGGKAASRLGIHLPGTTSNGTIHGYGRIPGLGFKPSPLVERSSANHAGMLALASPPPSELSTRDRFM